MNPILFEDGDITWAGIGLGVISDAVSCEVTEEANCGYELRMQLPANSRMLPQLALRRQILAAPNPYDQPQPFRIVRISKPIRGLVTVTARHISYDLSGVVIGAFTASTAAEAIAAFNSQQVRMSHCVFSFSTTIGTAEGSMSNNIPISLRSMMGPAESEGTLLAVYGGDLKFDRLNVELTTRGADRGFSVVHGVNMTDLTHDEDCEELWSGIIPYWHSNDKTVCGSTCLPTPTPTFVNIKGVDLTSEFSTEPSVAELTQHGQAYVARNGIGVPDTSIKLSFVPPGARGLHDLEQLQLFDTVAVRYPDLGIDVKKTVVKTVFDALRERYISVEIGKRQRYVAETLAAPVGQKGSVGGGGGGGGGGGKPAIAAGAVTEKVIRKESIKSEHLVDKAVITAKIKEGAVSYGKTDTDVQGTLTQVGVNKSDIETINGYFTGRADFSTLAASYIILNGQWLWCVPTTIDGQTYNLVRYGGGG